MKGALVRHIAGCALLTLSVYAGAASDPWAWQLPRGFPIPAVPADNPMSEEKVSLGRRLFCEPRISVTGQHSCASCHDASRAFTDGKRVGLGATGASLPHNSMSLANVAYNVSFGWQKAHVRSLETQMLEPLLNEHPVELGLKGREQHVADELAADESYAAAFAAAFGDGQPVTFERMVKAIAAFERTLISGRSPFDRYVFDGEHGALAADAKRGMALFFSGRAGCASCHSGFNFSGAWRDVSGATGEPTFANNGASSAPMRVPTLRNIALTAPYMHDGRFTSLDEVLDHYEHVGEETATSTPSGARLPRLVLGPQERSDLLAFLRSLTDSEFVSRSVAATARFCPAPDAAQRGESRLRIDAPRGAGIEAAPSHKR